jgi:hypothetical protein
VELEHPGRVDLLGDQQGVAAALQPDVGAVDPAHLLGRLDEVAAAAELELVPVGIVGDHWGMASFLSIPRGPSPSRDKSHVTVRRKGVDLVVKLPLAGRAGA